MTIVFEFTVGIEKLFDDEDLVLKKEDKVSTVPIKVKMVFAGTQYVLSVFCVGPGYGEGVSCSWQGQCQRKASSQAEG